jgi:UDP-galactopyranose mutase
VHRYGPHLFHTNHRAPMEWLARFTELVPYEHKVEALLADGRHVPLPVNRHTINAVFNQALAHPEAVRAFLRAQAEPIAEPRNAAEHLNAHIGRTLTDLFFRPYTRKMWNLDLEELDASVVKRIPLRDDDEDRYFPHDEFQVMPRNGYTAAFESILAHPNIEVSLDRAFERGMEDAYGFCFNSMPIDEYFDFELGALPYRSIRFHHREVEAGYNADRASVVNFTDDGPLTRETNWCLLPNHLVHDTGRRTVTREEPCDYQDNAFERYYPVKTSDGRYAALYDRYKQMAEGLPNLRFIGRCGTYQYLDMHQVINQSLRGAEAWLRERMPTPRLV